MKDPLDPRQDPYQVFNGEAQRQGLPAQVFVDTRPMAIRGIFAQLRGQAQDPDLLEEARSTLTKADGRLWTDIFFYVVGRGGQLEQPLEEPPWQWETLLLPEMFQPRGFLQLILGDEEQLLEPIRPRKVTLKPQARARYEANPAPTWEITFPV
jgi:hypothetical protein